MAYNFLNEKTKGLIIGKIIEYDGEVVSYTSKSMSELFLVSTTGIMSDMIETINKSKEIYIQDMLGDIEKNDFKYEVFLTLINTPNYKYRIFFIKHNLSIYPVKIILDETISKELKWENYVIECKSEQEFINCLKLILNSQQVYSVIGSLLSI